MAAVRLDVISIGTLSRNRLWGETQPVRTPHATCTLIRSGERKILVDPGLPPQAIGARLFERAGLRPEQIDTIFLTNFRPAHRAGLALFTRAKIFIHQREQEAMAQRLQGLIDEAPGEDLDRALLLDELKLLESLAPAEDEQIAEHVDLFPLFGYTPGTCGLLISAPMTTFLIAGDAVPTLDHLLSAQLLPDTADLSAAGEAMREVYEIADLIIPGHDNLFANPRHAGL